MSETEQTTVHSAAPKRPEHGKDLLALRSSLRVTQDVFAGLIGITKSHLAQMEMKNSPVSPEIGSAAQAVTRAALSGHVRLPEPKRTIDWHNSKTFGVRPPFEKRPAHVCRYKGCVLEPVGDGDWPSRGHLWLFQGRKCRRRKYLDETGQIVLSPGRYSGDRVPSKVCGHCGRRRDVGKKWSARLGCDIFTRYCRFRKGDPADLQHDPPSHYVERRGRFVPLSSQQIAQLRGRSTLRFAVPRCELPDCPRLGKVMERSAVMQLKATDGSEVKIVTYRCRASKPHAGYRVLPVGEVAVRLAFGRYRWTDKTTGQQRETANRRRPVRRNRIMPAALCPHHGSPLTRVSGPWAIRNKKRCWKAVCTSGGELHWVESGGLVRTSKRPRWGIKRGAKPGIRPETKTKIRYAAAFAKAGVSKRQAARFVYKDKPASSYSNLKRLYHDYRAEITEQTERLSLEDAARIVRDLGWVRGVR